MLGQASQLISPHQKQEKNTYQSIPQVQPNTVLTHSLYVTNRNTKVILLPLLVFEPPTPIMYPSHTTHIKQTIPKPFTHSLYVTNHNTKRPTQDNCPSLHQSDGLCSHRYVLLMDCNCAVCGSVVLSDGACFVI
jgi:hypothetical protein